MYILDPICYIRGFKTEGKDLSTTPPPSPPRDIQISELTIPKALAVLGLDYRYLNFRLNLHFTPETELNPYRLPLRQWSTICNLLYIHPDQLNINYDYDYEIHRSGIWKALREGKFDLPLNRNVLMVLWHVVQDRHEQGMFYSKAFGFRRRWTTRWNRAKIYVQLIWRLYSMRRARRLRAERIQTRGDYEEDLWR